MKRRYILVASVQSCLIAIVAAAIIASFVTKSVNGCEVKIRQEFAVDLTGTCGKHVVIKVIVAIGTFLGTVTIADVMGIALVFESTGFRQRVPQKRRDLRRSASIAPAEVATVIFVVL